MAVYYIVYESIINNVAKLNHKIVESMKYRLADISKVDIISKY